MTAAELSVVTESLPGSQVGLTIEVPQEQVDRAFERALERLARRVRIGGFRPGKAPRPLLEARLGPAVIRDEVVEILVPGVVSQALRDRQIDAIDRPSVEVQQLERGRPARLTARVSVMPEVRLPDLDTLQVERRHTVVDEEMLQRRLGELRERLAQIQPVDREIREGDLAVVDLEVQVDGRRVPSEARRATEVEVREGKVIPELLPALLGRREGEVATADVTLPEDHPDPRLKGKPARLEVTVRGVKEKVVPELTDEVAKELSDGRHATVEAFVGAVREDLENEARRLDALAFEQAAVEAVVNASQVELPEALVAREVDRQMEDLEQRLRRQGMRPDRYFQYLNTTEAEYRQRLRPEAEGRIRVDLVLDELGKQMAVEPSQDEITEHMRAEAERDEGMRRNLDTLLGSPAVRSYFRHRLVRLRVLEGLVARLSGTAPETSGKAE
ncbi:MAG TPA: trigger factor [Candidatus Dormibacteraeota bacterium]|nr:trigger factor [Candidatus Dormibacteraeota bacterium]